MKILGIDPGTRILGWGLIEAEPDRLRALAHGVVRAGRDDLSNRLVRVFDGLEEVLRTYTPDEVAIESVFVAKDPHASIALGEGRGVAILAAAREGCPIHPYAPAEVKKAVAGNGRASKPQVQKMVRIHLAMLEIPSPFDAADALAVAICHARRRRIAPPQPGGRAADLLIRRRRGSSRAAFAALAAEVLARRSRGDGR
jgi:crossover junction endodeoxyribonuclease RuvC